MDVLYSILCDPHLSLVPP